MDTYTNPVYPGAFADPFVLKYCGSYWAYCTGDWPDGRRFGILHSPDLVHWQALAGALEPLAEGFPCYWAPEVVYDNGLFYMYYSAGDELNLMQIRVAVAEHPAGPFIDSGHVLTTESFAIDAHIFVDEDGTRYLFYATDYLDHSHIGTGTACARLNGPFALAELGRPAIRARYDWQVYDPQRQEKGGVRWHTVEGPFVLKRKGRYYQMFSAGNWQNLTYGVSYASTERIDTPNEWQQHADGTAVLPILRTIPNEVIGPGHNSVVRGPDNMQLFCVYHRWSQAADARQMAIDPLDWVGERMVVFGPSILPQPLPPSPTASDSFDITYNHGLGMAWDCLSGHWFVENGAAHQVHTGRAEALFRKRVPCLVAEVSLRAHDVSHPASSLGIFLVADSTIVLRCAIVAASLSLRVEWLGKGEWQQQNIPLPSDFQPLAYHLLRVEADGPRVRLTLDEGAVCWQEILSAGPEQIGLATEEANASFSGFALTVGWEQLFLEPTQDLAALGWAPDPVQPGWRCEQGELRYSGISPDTLIGKGPALLAYALVVNVRLDNAEPEGYYGIQPALTPNRPGPRLTIERVAQQQEGWIIRCHDNYVESILPLPAGFEPTKMQQLSFCKQRGNITISWEGQPIGRVAAPDEPTRIGLYAHKAQVAFDMVRLTALEHNA